MLPGLMPVGMHNGMGQARVHYPTRIHYTLSAEGWPQHMNAREITGPKAPLLIHGGPETPTQASMRPSFDRSHNIPCMLQHPMEYRCPLQISTRSGGAFVVKAHGQFGMSSHGGSPRAVTGTPGEHPRCLCGGRRMLLAYGSMPGCKQFVSRYYKAISKEQLRMCVWSQMGDVVTRGCQTVRSALHRSAQHAVRPARSHRGKHRINSSS